MLTPWYFCCCLDFPPARASVFLDILEVLEDKDASDNLRVFAIEELARTNVWMQIFALSRVIGLCNEESVSDSFLLVARRYLEGVLEHVPDQIRPEFKGLVEAVVTQRDEQRDIHALSVALEVVKGLTSGVPSSRPYIDLRDFLPQTLLLVALDTFSQRVPEFGVHFQEKLPTERVPLSAVLENALRRAYGRLSFCLALKIQRRFGSYLDVEQITFYLRPNHGLAGLDNDGDPDREHKLPRIDPTLEPDLMEAYAFARLVDESGVSAAETVNILIAESQLLVKLRELGPDQHRKAKWNPILRTLHRPDTVEEREALSVVFWQCTLWELAVAVDVATASKVLADIWIPGVEFDNTELNLRGPVAKSQLGSWHKQIVSIAKLAMQDRRKDVNVRVESGSELAFKADAGAILFSPWFSQHRASTARFRNVFELPQRGGQQDESRVKQVRYPGAQNYPTFLRLLVAASVSVRCLKVADLSDRVRFEHACLVVHATDVLRQYPWLQHYTGLENKQPIPWIQLNLISLASHTRRSLHRIGEGHDSRVAPETFLAIYSRMEEAKVASSVSKKWKFFHDYVLSQILLEWVRNAFGNAMDGSGAGRWLHHIGGVVSAAQENLSQPNMDASLLFRFLVDHSLYQGELDWREDLRKKGHRQDRLFPRNLLLGPKLPAVEWARDEWNEQQLKPQYLLNRAAERVAALDESDTVELRTRWTRELIELLGAVSEPIELDRYLRLRLLELIGLPFIEQESEFQAQIALVLIEFGSLYDQWQLIDSFFPLDFESWFVTSPARIEARNVLLEAIAIKVAGLDKGFDEAWSAQSPHERIRELRRRNLLLKAVRRAAMASSRSDLAGAVSLRSSVIRALNHLQRRQPVGERTISSSLLARGNKDLLFLEEGNSDMVPAIAQAIMVDPNRREARVTVSDYDFSVCDLNLFTVEKAELGRFIDVAGWEQSEGHDAVSVTAVVVERDGARFTFHCGLPWYYTDHRSGPDYQHLRAGDWVSLPLHLLKSDRGQLRWQVSAREWIKKLPMRVGDGNTAMLDVGMKRVGDAQQIVLRRLDRELPSKDWLIDLWDSDMSHCFVNTEHSQQVSAIYINGKWQPIDGGLSDLLLGGPYIGEQLVVVLCLLGRVASSRQMSNGIRVSTAPGRNYVLGPCDFEQDSWAMLEQMIDDLSGQGNETSGLLIIAESCIIMDDVKLRMCQNRPESDTIVNRYPDLSAPFDLRNLRWREIFDDQDNPEAASDGQGHWWIDLELAIRVTGFPVRIQIKLAQRAAIGKSIEVEVSHWFPRSAFAEGEQVETDRLRLGPSPANELLEWRELRQSNRLKISRVIGKVRDDGHVTCLTVNGFAVDCEAETLSMGWLSKRDKISLNRTRDVLVSWQRWIESSDRPEVDQSELPNAVRTSGYGEAIFVLVPRKRTSGTLCKVYWMTPDGPLKADLRLDNISQLNNVYSSRLKVKTTAFRRSDLSAILAAGPDKGGKIWNIVTVVILFTRFSIILYLLRNIDIKFLRVMWV